MQGIALLLLPRAWPLGQQVRAAAHRDEQLTLLSPHPIAHPLPLEESEREFRSAVCLCGTAACRGTFMFLLKGESSTPLQQVLRDETRAALSVAG
jgi:hypothetical protein